MPASPSVLDRLAPLVADIQAQAAGVDTERRYPSANLAALGKAGLMGLLIPEAQGGSGGSLTDLAVACEALGAACASTAMC